MTSQKRKWRMVSAFTNCTSTSEVLVRLAAYRSGHGSPEPPTPREDSINLFPTRRSTLLCFSYDAYFMDGQANSTGPDALLFNCLIEREHHYHQIGFRTRYLTLCALASSLLTNWIKTAVHVNFVKINILCRYFS